MDFTEHIFRRKLRSNGMCLDYDVNMQRPTASHGIFLTETSGGNLAFNDNKGYQREVICNLTEDAIYTLPDNATSTLVDTNSDQSLTTKAITDTSNTVFAKRLHMPQTFEDFDNMTTVDNNVGPSPQSRYAVLAALYETDSLASQVAFGSLHDISPIWHFEQDAGSGSTRDLTTTTWVGRYIDRIICDEVQNVNPSPNPIKYPWNIYNMVTLSNAGLQTHYFTMVAGIYEARINCLGFRCGYHKIGLLNVTTSTYLTYAESTTTAYSDTVFSTTSVVLFTVDRHVGVMTKAS